MNRKSEEGYTGIDIAVSVVVLFIFISLIASLSYRFNRSAKEIELKAEATERAVEKIEEVKNSLSFEEIKDIINASEYGEAEEISGRTKYLRRVIIQDYADIDDSKEPGVVKKVTVQVLYYFDAKKQEINLSTILSKES